jgi:serine phosphatase RsbU (regulator of sigma subunit)
MTDGFTERFNENNEMIGDKRAKVILLESAGESAGNIIERFVKESDEWGGNRPQDDDATFVVIKIK